MSLKIFWAPNTTSAPLGIVITIVNPNYGNFKYVNSSGYLKYRDTIIAEVPLGIRSFPARSTTNVSTTVGIMTDKLIQDPKFLSDIEGGVFNLTAEATLPGKVTMIKILRLKAKIYISCGVSFNIIAVDASSRCMSKIKLWLHVNCKREEFLHMLKLICSWWGLGEDIWSPLPLNYYSLLFFLSLSHWFHFILF